MTLLCEAKANGAKAHSFVKLKFQSSQPMLIPHWRRKRRYHTASSPYKGN